MDPVRFGLVGYGFGGRYFHRPLLASAPECDLLGVVTTSPERRALVEADQPGLRCFDSLEALVAAGCEAVAISTPADTHTELTDAALRLGLAVVCDKPFALDADAARATAALAAEHGLALSPYQNRRWDSDFLTVRALLDDGSLGTITRFESRFERYAPERGPGAAGGGTLLDFCSHLADQALVLLGPVRRVYAEYRVRETGRDDDVFVSLTHESGAHAQLWGSWSQAAPGPRYRVTGTGGTFVLSEPMDGQEARLVAGETPATLGEAWGSEPREAWGTFHGADHDGAGHGGAGSRMVPSERGAWDTFYPAFARAVRGEGPLPVEAADAVATAVVLDAARRSAETGTVVDLDG